MSSWAVFVLYVFFCSFIASMLGLAHKQFKFKENLKHLLTFSSQKRFSLQVNSSCKIHRNVKTCYAIQGQKLNISLKNAKNLLVFLISIYFIRTMTQQNLCNSQYDISMHIDSSIQSIQIKNLFTVNCITYNEPFPIS